MTSLAAPSGQFLLVERPGPCPVCGAWAGRLWTHVDLTRPAILRIIACEDCADGDGREVLP